MTFKVVGDKELAKNTKVNFESQSITLTWNDETIVVPLSNPIDADLS